MTFCVQMLVTFFLDIGSRQQFTQVVNIYPKDGDRNETSQNTSTLIQFGETRNKSNDVLTVNLVYSLSNIFILRSIVVLAARG